MDTCPPLEDIAAFLDGMLSPEERERVTEHLARCESCYEIFAGAVHFEVASSAEGTDRRGVIPFPLAEEKDRAPRRMSRWLPLAASVLLAVGIGWAGWHYLVEPPVSIAAFARPLEDKPGIAAHLYEGDVYRSGEAEVDLFGQKSSFLTGVHLLDLRLSVYAGDWERTKSLLQDLGTTAENISTDLGKSFSQDYLSLNGSADFDQLALQLPAKEAELEELLLEDDSFQLGKWAEAGRLSARTQTREFFRWKNRRFLSSLLKNPPGEGDESLASVPGDLQAIEAIWDRGEFRSQDYEDLAGRFEKIIKTYETASTELEDLSLDEQYE